MTNYDERRSVLGRALTAALLALALALLSAGAALAQPSGPGPGNSPNAELCRTAWQTLVDADGNPFANRGECLSYAAQGGTPSEPLSLQAQWEALCLEHGGFVITPDPARQWACSQVPEIFDEMATICEQAGGAAGGLSSIEGWLIITCDLL